MIRRIALALVIGTFCLGLISPAAAAEEVEGGFVHHVFFFFNEPDNAEHRKLFLEEIEKMKAIPAIRLFSIGTPAGTPRDVVDNSWTFDLLVTFDDKAGWQVYNDHPIHLQFSKSASHVWKRVQVYDTIKK
jgi:hypothetical protein